MNSTDSKPTADRARTMNTQMMQCDECDEIVEHVAYLGAWRAFRHDADDALCPGSELERS